MCVCVFLSFFFLCDKNYRHENFNVKCLFKSFTLDLLIVLRKKEKINKKIKKNAELSKCKFSVTLTDDLLFFFFNLTIWNNSIIILRYLIVTQFHG